MLMLMFVFGLTGSAFAQTPGFGLCPNVDFLESFDVDEFGGLWYENQRSVPNVHELNTKCATANISRIDSETLKVVILQISTLTGDESIVVGSGVVDTDDCDNSTECGKLLLEFPLGIIGHVQRSYWIIDTDYTSYSIIWSCTDHFLTHTKYLWILTRDAEPSDSTLEAVTNVLLKNKIDNIPLKGIEQNDCP